MGDEKEKVTLQRRNLKVNIEKSGHSESVRDQRQEVDTGRRTLFKCKSRRIKRSSQLFVGVNVSFRRFVVEWKDVKKMKGLRTKEITDEQNNDLSRGLGLGLCPKNLEYVLF